MRPACVPMQRCEPDKLQLKQNTLAIGGIAQSQGESINDALKHPDVSEHRSSLCLSKRITEKVIQKENFSTTFLTSLLHPLFEVCQYLALHSTCSESQRDLSIQLH